MGLSFQFPSILGSNIENKVKMIIIFVDFINIIIFVNGRNNSLLLDLEEKSSSYI